jgi:cyanate permease
MTLFTIPAVVTGLFVGFFSYQLEHASVLLLLACGLWVVALGFCLKPKPSLPLWLFAGGGALAVALNMVLAVAKAWSAFAIGR